MLILAETLKSITSSNVFIESLQMRYFAHAGEVHWFRPESFCQQIVQGDRSSDLSILTSSLKVKTLILS